MFGVGRLPARTLFLPGVAYVVASAFLPEAASVLGQVLDAARSTRVALVPSVRSRRAGAGLTRMAMTAPR